ncbi:MAG TPA: hypothetical protein DHV62_03545, partial [Elusimicrobia bacterium]|nr:hypothetical protein [Elusimicrobiota bacterium]
MQDKYIHKPVKEQNCSSCHRSVKTPKELTAQGNQLCFTCHKSLAKEVKEKKVHSLLQGAECLTCHQVHSGNNPSLLNDFGKDCTNCHDPNDTKKAHFGIFVKKGTCLSCHQAHTSSVGKLLIETGHPMFLEGGCDACHTATGADGKSKLNAKSEKLCFTCHADTEELGKKKVVHAVFSDCTFCHSGHVSKEKKLLLKKMNNICYECHLPETFKEHPVPKHPVYFDESTQKKKLTLQGDPSGRAFNCLSCHSAHASDNQKMFNDTGKDCTNCHKVEEKKITQAHAGIFVSRDKCFNCHNLRKPASAHPDFANKNCFACHSAKTKEGKIELVKTGKELCYLCHPAIKESLDKKYPHGIVKDGECNTCHEVHSSLERSLLNATGNDCGTCHDPTDLKKPHFGIIAKKESCTKCHNPHGSDKEKLLLTKGHPFIYDKTCDPCHQSSSAEGKVLLVAEGEKLCLMCHGDIEEVLKKKFVHRVAKECTSCHLAHLSNFSKLLPKSGERLCYDCHSTVGEHPIRGHPIRGVIDLRFSKEKKPLTCISCHNPHGAD